MNGGDELNFETEVICFYDWLETNSVGSSSINLWFALLHTWFKAGCPVEFAVAISVLETKTGLKKDAIYDARNKLQQVGRVLWRERKGNQSAMYKIVSFITTQTVCIGNTDTNTHTKPTQTPTQYPTQVPTIISSSNSNIYNNTPTNNVSEIPTQTPTQTVCIGNTDTNTHGKPLEDDGTCNPFIHYQRLFGVLRPLAVEEIKDYSAQGLEDKLICLAMDRSHENGAGHWNYAKKILDRCVFEKVLNVDVFLAKEEEFRAKKTIKINKDSQQSVKSKFANFSQRDWNYEDIERKSQEALIQEFNNNIGNQQ